MKRFMVLAVLSVAPIALVLSATVVTAAGQDRLVSPVPPPGEIWVYPQGVFSDDFHALWLAVNGTPYVAGDLPYPYCDISDTAPGAKPVFVGSPPTGQSWTVVLKTRRLVPLGDDQYLEGEFTAFNLGLAAGKRITNKDLVRSVNYWLSTANNRFSTGFGDVNVRRSVQIQGEITPNGEECFFQYTPNFDPAANPDTNAAFHASWLPPDYPCGSEYEPGKGFGIRSTRSVVYGGYIAFHVRPVNVDLSVSDCLLYGQYGLGISINNGPSHAVIRNVDVRHMYHCLQASSGAIGMLTWAINIQNQLGGGGQHLIEGCTVDQSPTWQEYYFEANSSQQGYPISYTRGSHAVTVYYQWKELASDCIRIENSMFTNRGSNCVVYQQSNLDLRVANCLIDGGYFSYTPTKASPFPDWRGNCVIVSIPMADQWNKFPDIEIVQNQLVARGWDAWGARLFGCGNGRVVVQDNWITCAAGRPGYAGGVELCAAAGVGSNENIVARNMIDGTGAWALSVTAFDTPCERNMFLDNILSNFSAAEAGAVFFGPTANDNYISGDVGAGIVDLGTGNIVEQLPALAAAGVDGRRIIAAHELMRRQFRCAVSSMSELALMETPVDCSGWASPTQLSERTHRRFGRSVLPDERSVNS